MKTKARSTVGESSEEQSAEISEQSPEVLGTEVWNGKKCLVVKGIDDKGNESKWWLWMEHGIPIKVELTTSDGKFVNTELHNIEVGDIVDNMFELPDGVQIMEMPSL